MKDGWIHCEGPDCDRKIKDDKWRKIKTDRWFFTKGDAAWCPDHIPDWVQEWRKKMGQ